MGTFVSCMTVAVRRSRGWGVTLACIAGLLGGSAQAATVPSGFVETVVASGLVNPTAMAFAPDGRLFVLEQGGLVRVVDSTGLLPTPFHTLTVNAIGERGLLGIAFDPRFEENQWIYLYYTATSPTIHNRVSRFTANGNVVVPGSEVILLDLEPLGPTNHNGGAIHFGPDGALYVAVGDNANGNNSQTLGNRLGKMLRINADGSIPADNPFYDVATGDNRAIWALGLRNPFTFAIQPLNGAMLINDVGERTFEEINIGAPGANYGWPFTEGPTGDEAFISPLHSYGRAEGCAITGGAFYSPWTTQYPAEYPDTYFFADFCGGWIRRLLPSGEVIPFASGISQPVDLKVWDGDGALYYLSRGGGTVVRIDNVVAPRVDVTANGEDGHLRLQPSDSLVISLSFDAGPAGSLAPAELYIGVWAPGLALWLNTATGQWQEDPVPAHSGPLADFGPAVLFNLESVASLPRDTTFHWIVLVNNDADGVLEGHHWDVVRTTIQSATE